MDGSDNSLWHARKQFRVWGCVERVVVGCSWNEWIHPHRNVPGRCDVDRKNCSGYLCSGQLRCVEPVVLGSRRSGILWHQPNSNVYGWNHLDRANNSDYRVRQWCRLERIVVGVCRRKCWKPFDRNIHRWNHVDAANGVMVGRRELRGLERAVLGCRRIGNKPGLVVRRWDYLGGIDVDTGHNHNGEWNCMERISVGHCGRCRLSTHSNCNIARRKHVDATD